MTNQQQQEYYKEQQQQHLSTIEAMCRQESNGYTCDDYLQRQVQANKMTTEDAAVHIRNRLKMVQWCTSLVDCCNLERETVSAAISCLDRYLSTPTGSSCIRRNCSEEFQLASITCLYSLQKISGGPILSPEMLSNISRGFYSAQDLEQMEWNILAAIQWRVNVPTPLAFVRELLRLIPHGLLSDESREQAYALAKLQTEMVVGDYSLVSVNASTIAIAAIWNALETLQIDGLQIDGQLIQQFVLSKTRTTGPALDIQSDEVIQIQGCLFLAIAACSDALDDSETASKKLVNASPARRRSYTISPRTVCNQAA